MQEFGITARVGRAFAAADTVKLTAEPAGPAQDIGPHRRVHCDHVDDLAVVDPHAA